MPVREVGRFRIPGARRYRPTPKPFPPTISGYSLFFAWLLTAWMPDEVYETLLPQLVSTQYLFPRTSPLCALKVSLDRSEVHTKPAALRHYTTPTATTRPLATSPPRAW